MLPAVYLIGPFAHLGMAIESYATILLNAVPPRVILKTMVLASLFY
jgi:hypothetical protein